MALENLRVRLADNGRVIISFDPTVKGTPAKTGKSDILANCRWHKLDEVDPSLAGYKLNLMVIKPIAKAKAKPAAAAADDDDAGFDSMTLPELKKAARTRGLKAADIINGAPNDKLAMKRLRLALEEHDAENAGSGEDESQAPENDNADPDASEYKAPRLSEVRDQIKVAAGCTNKQARAIYEKLCGDEYDWSAKPRQFKKDVLEANEALAGGDNEDDGAVERAAADDIDDEPPAKKPRTNKAPAAPAKSGSKVRPADALKAQRAGGKR